MTRVLALADQSKIGCITPRRFAKVGTKTHPQRGAALDRNGLSVSTETACRFEPKSPAGNSEICTDLLALFDIGQRVPQCQQPLGAEPGSVQLLVRCNGNLAVIDCRRRLAGPRDSVIPDNVNAHGG